MSKAGRKPPAEAHWSEQGFVTWLRQSILGRILVTLIGAALVVLLTVLISWNNLERFLFITGVEWVVVVVVSWIRFFMNRRADS